MLVIFWSFFTQKRLGKGISENSHENNKIYNLL